MKPTYEKLKHQLEKAEHQLEKAEHQLEKTNQFLKQALDRIAELEEKLKLNSKNSSKPPSTDQKANTEKPPPKKPRKGHPGVCRTPYPPSRIDNHIKCIRETCPHCGLTDLQESILPPDYLQQVDLPEIRAIITQYALIKYQCQKCHKHSLGKLPKEISPSTFGPKLAALLSLLTGVFHLAKREAKQLIQDLYHIDISIGSIPNIEEKVTKALTPIYERIHHFAIKSTDCKHFDETTWRNSGKRNYVWLATTKHAALYKIHPNRSNKAFKELTLGNTTFQAVTDRYATYNKIGKDHQYCLAHLIRDCHRWSERDGPDGKIGENLEKFLKRSCKAHRNFSEKKISLKERNKIIGYCKYYFEKWLVEGITFGSELLYKWCMHLDKTLFKLWTFFRFSDMDPTNNLAERDLRKIVVWRKKSYGTRSERGKKFVERITSVAETLKKQKMNILKFIQKALVANISGQEAPYICLSRGF